MQSWLMAKNKHTEIMICTAVAPIAPGSGNRFFCSTAASRTTQKESGLHIFTVSDFWHCTAQTHSLNSVGMAPVAQSILLPYSYSRPSLKKIKSISSSLPSTSYTNPPLSDASFQLQKTSSLHQPLFQIPLPQQTHL